jgi:transposase
MKPACEPLAVSRQELAALIARAQAGPLDAADCRTLQAVVDTLERLTQLLADKSTTIARLRQMLFGSSTEKTENVLKAAEQDQHREEAASGETEAAAPGSSDSPAGKSRDPKKGHGRNGAAAYTGATRIKVSHPTLTAGDPCPACLTGKVYNSQEPGLLVRITGQAPLGAVVYELDKLRCNLCGEIFTAPAPEGLGEAKYDAQSAAMIALLKYGSGVPLYRLEQLQGSLGIPLPAATQWAIAQATAHPFKPAFAELIRQAAQGDVVYNDDTVMKILALMGKRSTHSPRVEASEEAADESKRTGIFTSGIVATGNGHPIALFFTGRQHAGENLHDVLQRRAAELGPPIQMCDALSRNPSKAFETILSNCLAHGRRKFVEVAENFPRECRTVLEILGKVYDHDAIAEQQKMSPQERLLYHQTHSGPWMDQLKSWATAQLDDRKVEPNSGLGKAIAYLLRHWDKLTVFLRVPGAPLDNNLCEQALKRAILHRKNSLFYKTLNGAQVGDLFMSLIHTCRLNGVNPFDYLTELQKHAGELARNPQDWMPWNYRATLQDVDSPLAAAA